MPASRARRRRSRSSTPRRPRWSCSAPAYRLATRVLANPGPGKRGVLNGNLYLRGGGDPTFGSAPFIAAPLRRGRDARSASLAWQLARVDGIRRVTGRIVRRRELLGLAARRAVERLRVRPLSRRPAQRARVQPRPERRIRRARTRQAQYAAQQLAGSLRGFGVRVEGAAAARRSRRRAPRRSRPRRRRRSRSCSA